MIPNGPGRLPRRPTSRRRWTLKTSWCGCGYLHRMWPPCVTPATGKPPPAGRISCSGRRPPGRRRCRRTRAPGRCRTGAAPAPAGGGGRRACGPPGRCRTCGRGRPDARPPRPRSTSSLAPSFSASSVAEAGLVEGGAQRAGQVGLGQAELGRAGLPGPPDRVGQQQAGGRVDHPRGGEVGRGRGPADQGQVERGPGGLDPVVQPVEPAGAPGDPEPEQHQDQDGQHHDGPDHDGLTSCCYLLKGVRRTRAAC